MASFDFINAASKGYEFIWKERSYLLSVAAPVLFVKISCLLAVFALNAQDKYLLQGLIYLPAFVVEAIFIIGLIRYFLYREPIFIWGKLVPPPSSDIKPKSYGGYMTRNQCVQGGIALYLLLRVIETALLGVSMDFTQNSPPVDIIEDDVANLSPVMASLIMFSILIAFTWIFRFLWLFIPTASGYPISYYLKEIPGIRISAGMVATWIICSLPLMTVFSALLQATGSGNGDLLSIISSSIIRAIAELIIVSVQITAMTYGIHKILSGEKD